MTRRDPMLRIFERAERQEMASTVTIRRPGSGSTNAAGNITYASTLVYSGAATVARTAGATRTLTYGSQAVTVSGYEVIVPRGTNVADKDVVNVVASVDPTLAGKHLRVVDASGSDWSANRVLSCEVA